MDAEFAAAKQKHLRLELQPFVRASSIERAQNLPRRTNLHPLAGLQVKPLGRCFCIPAAIPWSSVPTLECGQKQLAPEICKQDSQISEGDFSRAVVENGLCGRIRAAAKFM